MHGENSFVIQIMKVVVTRPVMRMKTVREKGGDGERNREANRYRCRKRGKLQRNGGISQRLRLP